MTPRSIFRAVAEVIQYALVGVAEVRGAIR
jgi:hypothetical protein